MSGVSGLSGLSGLSGVSGLSGLSGVPGLPGLFGLLLPPELLPPEPLPPSESLSDSLPPVLVFVVFFAVSCVVNPASVRCMTIRPCVH
ncbi:hypothetical protein DW779_02390 [Clostridium sp. AM30-24]|nr:hypothetical protein DW779_02390 [Clostridium sp. AM30-24]